MWLWEDRAGLVEIFDVVGFELNGEGRTGFGGTRCYELGQLW